MTETRWKGNWWLPEDPEDSRPGTLHHDDDGELRLELIGGFGVDVRTPMPDGAVGVGIDGSFPVIHGVAGGDCFTLFNCQATHTAGGFTGANVAEQTITALKGLRGIHVSDADEEVFTSMELRFEYLLAWSSSTSISTTIQIDQSRWAGRQTASSEPVEDRVATFKDLTITLQVPHTQFRVDTKHSGNRRSVESHEFGEIEIASATPSSLNQFDRIAKALQDLLTLAAHSPAGVLKRSLWFQPPARPDGEEPRAQEIEVLGSMVYKAGSNARNDPYHGYLFTLNDVPFADIVGGAEVGGGHQAAAPPARHEPGEQEPAPAGAGGVVGQQRPQRLHVTAGHDRRPLRFDEELRSMDRR